MSENIINARLRGNVAPLTRRRLLKTLSVRSAAGAGLGLLAGAGASREALAQNGGGQSSISSNFNGTQIVGGDWIWFTSVLKVHGLGNSAVTIGFVSSTVEFSVNGMVYVLGVPPAMVTFSPSVTLATTSFNSLGQWVTVVPLSGLAGNVFLDAIAFQVPSSGFPGGIQPVTWQGIFTSTTNGVTVQWQWAAAVYDNSSFGSDYTQLAVKPVDDNKASIYQNSDHAGTPENFTTYVIGGARGGGGSNYTGSYSATGSAVPIPASSGGGC